MTAEREQELQNTILSLATKNVVLEKQVAALERDLAHVTRDIADGLRADMSLCRTVLVALNNKMKLVDPLDLELPDV